MTTKPIPDGYNALIPSFIVRNAAKAIEFYRDVFGATEALRMPSPDGSKIVHAELKIRNHVLMLGDECPEMGAFAPQGGATQPAMGVMIYVSDVDSTYKKALALGAKGTMSPMDMFWGDRFGKFIDPFGHSWAVATHTRDVSPEECAKAAAECGKKKPE